MQRVFHSEMQTVCRLQLDDARWQWKYPRLSTLKQPCGAGAGSAKVVFDIRNASPTELGVSRGGKDYVCKDAHSHALAC